MRPGHPPYLSAYRHLSAYRRAISARRPLIKCVGGLPKSLKTWLATEIALAVAAGTKALGRFDAKTQGPVVFFGAEDQPPALRVRFQAVADARAIRLKSVPLFLLDTTELRLDDLTQLARLHKTVEAARARLVVLDPFVRMARIDENSAQEVSGVLGSLRALQREHDVAVLVVHHMRKSPAARLGQQLRGSGDFAAWSDSALYTVRRDDEQQIVLSAEHRAAPAPAPLRVRLELHETPHLVVDDDTPAGATDYDSLESAIVEHLSKASKPVTGLELLRAVRVRKSRLLGALRALRARGTITRSDDGWRLTRADTRGHETS